MGENTQAVGFSTVLEREIHFIAAARKARLAKPSPAGPIPSTEEPQLTKPFDGVSKNTDGGPKFGGDSFRRAREMDLVGLAFSGGGIRSATYNLGILQGLAKYKVLPHIDYLSTVSGGGYIGAWLMAWITRAAGPGAREKLLAVQDNLRPEADYPKNQQVEPIRYLRRYSNYLTPQNSMFSADTWTMIAIWSRNTVLNLAIIVCAVAALLLVARIAGNFIAGIATQAGAVWQFPPPWPEAWFAALPLLFAVLAIGWNLFSVAGLRHETESSNKSPQGFPRVRKLFSSMAKFVYRHQAAHRGVQVLIILPTLISAIALALWMIRIPDLFDVHWKLWPSVGLAALFLIIALMGDFIRCFTIQRAIPSSRPLRQLLGFGVALLASSVAGFVTAAMLHGVARLLNAIDENGNGIGPWAIITVGPPLVLLAFSMGVILHVGLMGRDLPDASREWLGRLRAWAIIYTAGWLAIVGGSNFGPYGLFWLGAWTSAGVGSAWVLTTIAGLFAGSSDKTNGTSDRRSSTTLRMLRQAIAHIAPYAFVTGFVLLIGLGIHEFVSHRTGKVSVQEVQTVTVQGSPQKVTLTIGDPQPRGAAAFDSRKRTYGSDLRSAQFSSWPPAEFDLRKLDMLLLILLVALGLLAWRVDVNEFSMHHFYKNRLVRCYLGASRSLEPERCPHPFTGFDDDDDFPLADLAFDKLESASAFTQKDYCGPYPIINGTLNLAGGTALAWQERKAASYIFTPQFCGYDKPFVDNEASGGTVKGTGVCSYGYRRTESCAYRGGINVGTAAGISGAAASPNSGSHTSTAVAFLLTVFNARLGWWLGNPARDDKYYNSGPSIGLPYLLVELFGLANTDKAYVNVSDGGHFENLGIYELVRRGCQYIIAGDGEQDPHLTCGGLANAIRKCRTDLGVHIDINLDSVKRVNGLSGAHCVVGTIKYPNDNSPGYLLYLKSSLTGNEDSDVLEYYSRKPEFPHQSTGDQWFDESQFESYRRLGLHVAEAALGSAFKLREAGNNEEYSEVKKNFFENLRETLYPPSKAIEQSFTRHTELYSKLMDELAQAGEFSYLDDAIFSDWRTLDEPPKVEVKRRARYWCNSVLQLMENVYLDLGLADPKERDHPHNAGWLRIFRKWAITDLFRDTWHVTGGTYGKRFRQFYAHLIKAELKTLTGTWTPTQDPRLVIPDVTAILLESEDCEDIAILKGSFTFGGGDTIDLTGFRHNGSHLCFEAGLPGEVTPRKFRMRFVDSNGRMSALLIAEGANAEARFEKAQLDRRAASTV